jgi:hypothetical protein
MENPRASSPISSNGKNHVLTAKIDNYPFADNWDKTAYKKEVEMYANMRVSQNRPEDKGKSLTAIRSEIYANIYEHWQMLKNGYEFDFPITDLV